MRLSSDGPAGKPGRGPRPIVVALFPPTCSPTLQAACCILPGILYTFYSATIVRRRATACSRCELAGALRGPLSPPCRRPGRLRCRPSLFTTNRAASHALHVQIAMAFGVNMKELRECNLHVADAAHLAAGELVYMPGCADHRYLDAGWDGRGWEAREAR